MHCCRALQRQCQMCQRNTPGKPRWPSRPASWSRCQNGTEDTLPRKKTPALSETNQRHSSDRPYSRWLPAWTSRSPSDTGYRPQTRWSQGLSGRCQHRRAGRDYPNQARSSRFQRDMKRKHPMRWRPASNHRSLPSTARRLCWQWPQRLWSMSQQCRQCILHSL
jgi:hypothetical protein